MSPNPASSPRKKLAIPPISSVWVAPFDRYWKLISYFTGLALTSQVNDQTALRSQVNHLGQKNRHCSWRASSGMNHARRNAAHAAVVLHRNKRTAACRKTFAVVAKASPGRHKQVLHGCNHTP